MPQKVVIGDDGQARRVELTGQELAQRQREDAAHAAEVARLAARPPGKVAEEEVIEPRYDAASPDAKMLRAMVAALVDVINEDRAARSAPAISMAQIRAGIRTKLAEA